jgi:hypothetical protein
MTLVSNESIGVRDALGRLARAGVLTGVTDGLFSSVLSVAFYHSTVERLFQGVASTLIGRQALDGGTPMALLGVAMHFGVAFGWSAVFLFLVMRLRWVQRVLALDTASLRLHCFTDL